MDTPTNNMNLYTIIDEDNVAWLHLDKQDTGTNVLSAELLEDLYEELTQFDENPPRGLIIVSDKTNEVRSRPAEQTYHPARPGSFQLP